MEEKAAVALAKAIGVFKIGMGLMLHAGRGVFIIMYGRRTPPLVGAGTGTGAGTGAAADGRACGGFREG